MTTKINSYRPTGAWQCRSKMCKSVWSIQWDFHYFLSDFHLTFKKWASLSPIKWCNCRMLHGGYPCWTSKIILQKRLQKSSYWAELFIPMLSFKNHASTAFAKILTLRYLTRKTKQQQNISYFLQRCAYSLKHYACGHTQKPPYKVLTWSNKDLSKSQSAAPHCLNKDLSKLQFAAPQPWAQCHNHLNIQQPLQCEQVWFDNSIIPEVLSGVGLAITCLCCCPIHSWSLALGSGVGQHQTPAPESDMKSWKECALHCTTHTLHLPDLCQALKVE